MTQVKERSLTSHNPANPAEVVAETPLVADEALDRILDAAGAAAGTWAGVASARSAALSGWADDLENDLESLAALVMREVGKPIVEARAEVARSVSILRYYAQAAFDSTGDLYPSPDGRASLTAERLPLGTILAITPWNFPLAAPAWKVAAALAYGNTVVLKPSSAAAGTASQFIALARTHVPEGVLALAVATTSQTERLLDDPRIAGVSFTGSDAVGHEVVARVAKRGGQVQAEMGGQNPSIILDDASLEPAVRIIASAAMAYAGQKCTATSRVIISRSISSLAISALVEAIASLQVGDPSEPGTVVGPLISERARHDVDHAVDLAVQRGASILVGGSVPDADGWYYQPSLVRLDNPLDEFAQVETFGPAASILIADDDDHAIEIANSTRYGLSAAVFGQDVDRATRLARQLKSGLIRVNASTTGADFWVPFGGEGASSYGPREQGRAAREFFTKTRTVLVNPPLP